MGNIRTFQVTITYPLNESIDIQTDVDIKLMFNTDVDRLTISESIAVIEHLSGHVIPGIVQKTDSRTIVFKPVALLQPGMMYDVFVKKTLKNILGNPCKSYSFSFTTSIDQNIDMPLIIAPIDMGTILTQPSFQWNSVPDAVGYEIQLSSSSEFATITWSTSVTCPIESIPRIIELIPTNILEEGHLYFWHVRASIYDLEGEIVNGPWSLLHRFIIESELNPVILDEDIAPLPEPDITTLIQVFPEIDFSNVSTSLKTIYIVVEKILDITKLDPRRWFVVGKYVTGDDTLPEWSKTISTTIKKYHHGQLGGSWSIIIDRDNQKTIIVFQPNAL